SDPETGYRSPEKLVGFKYTASVALDLDDPVYQAAKNQGFAALRSSLRAAFAKYRLDAVVYPTWASASSQPAPLIKPEATPTNEPGAIGDPLMFADESGFPDLFVPAGMTNSGLPVAISFLGQPFSEPQILGYAYDFE